MKANKIIGVIGGGKASNEIFALAEKVGQLIAQKNGVLICGGLYGVMEAVCRGARKFNGLTIGILPGFQKEDANPYVDIPIVTGMADARNIIIVRTADVVIAIDGEFGTLSEISFCLKFNVPVVGLNTWDIDKRIVKAISAEDAVNKAFEIVI